MYHEGGFSNNARYMVYLYVCGVSTYVVYLYVRMFN